MTTQADIDFVLGRTVSLEARQDETDAWREKTDKHLAAVDRKLESLPKIERMLGTVSGQLGSVGKAVGLRDFAPLPDDWEDITQVKRPALRKLEEERNRYERKSKTRPVMAMGGSALVMGIIEIVRQVLAGHIQFH